jgi:hypothetical protein
VHEEVLLGLVGRAAAAPGIAAVLWKALWQQLLLQVLPQMLVFLVAAAEVGEEEAGAAGKPREG